jgi:hypothetical protein
VKSAVVAAAALLDLDLLVDVGSSAAGSVAGSGTDAWSRSWSTGTADCLSAPAAAPKDER